MGLQSSIAMTIDLDSLQDTMKLKCYFIITLSRGTMKHPYGERITWKRYVGE